METKISKLVESINKANLEALKFSNTEDGGSCNFDSVIIKLNNWKEHEIHEVSKLTRVSIGDKLSGFWSNYRFLSTIKYGQANCRTKMAEASYKSLKNDGFDVHMYYAID